MTTDVIGSIGFNGLTVLLATTLAIVLIVSAQARRAFASTIFGIFVFACGFVAAMIGMPFITVLIVALWFGLRRAAKRAEYSGDDDWDDE